MKTIILFLLTASAFAADININFPPLTERQKDGLKFVANRENAIMVAAGQTNWAWTFQTYRQTNVLQVLESQVTAAHGAILENYAMQRDEQVIRARLRALEKKLLTATDAQLTQIESIVSTNEAAP